MDQNIKRFPVLAKFNHSVQESVEYSISIIQVTGIVGLFGFPGYYYTWTYLFPQPYESIVLRSIGFVFCMGLALSPYWPSSWHNFFAYYWYISLSYCVPFFFTLMLFKNNFSTVWLLSNIGSIFLIIIALEWRIACSCYFTVSCLAWFTYYWENGSNPSNVLNMVEYLPTFLFVLIPSVMMMYHRMAFKEKEKLEALQVVSGSMAHELRTPLGAIGNSALAIKTHFSTLVDAYHLAARSGLAIKPISALHLHYLPSSVEIIEKEVAYSHMVIDMLLQNAQKDQISVETFEIQSISHSIDEAIKRFTSDEDLKEMIHWNKDENQDFTFLGSDILMSHVLFNLLKNAAYFVRKAGKGKIELWTEIQGNLNQLHFKDTGMGIEPTVLKNIFTPFYTTVRSGTGVGLSFCKKVMQSFDGDISCHSKASIYTEFVLTFPKVKNQVA